MQRNKGFTLIEVAIVLLIGGILLATASTLLLSYMKKVQINTTERRLAAIDEALQLFLSLNGRYPCVADPAVPLDDANFGREAADCSTPAAAAGGRGGRAVRVGAVPVRTLNLPDDYIADAWSARFTYAITQALAETGTYNRDEGAIFVVDSTDPADPLVDSVVTPPGAAHYVIVSHGANNSGAVPIGGGAAVACPAGNIEEENCNGDAIYRSTMLLGTADNAQLYDDLLSVRAVSAFGNQIPAGAVLPFNLSACPQGWINFSSAQGRVIVGTGGTYSTGATGGSEDWTLSGPEAGYVVSPSTLSPAAMAPGGTSFLTPTTPSAHENRPPYIVLRFCEKT